MRAVSRGLRRHFPWNDRVWLVRGGAVALSPKRIAAICRSTSLLQGRARDFLRGTHSLKPNFVSVTVFPCASSKLCFCGYPHPQSTKWDGGRENLLDVILWFLTFCATQRRKRRESDVQRTNKNLSVPPNYFIFCRRITSLIPKRIPRLSEN